MRALFLNASSINFDFKLLKKVKRLIDSFGKVNFAIAFLGLFVIEELVNKLQNVTQTHQIDFFTLNDILEMVYMIHKKHGSSLDRLAVRLVLQIYAFGSTNHSFRNTNGPRVAKLLEKVGEC